MRLGEAWKERREAGPTSLDGLEDLPVSIIFLERERIRFPLGIERERIRFPPGIERELDSFLE